MPRGVGEGDEEGRSAAHERWQLVGRHEELARARDALRNGSVSAVVIHGAAGVGKSRLAAELVERAERDGRVVLRARATAVAATMPFGAFAHLLPTGVLTRDDPVDRYREIVEGLPHRQGRLVVYVDDLQHLDAATVGLLAQLLDGGEVFLVATVRTTTAANPVVASLWRRDDVVRIDLGELSRDDVDTLLHLVLGGPVHSDAVAAIWSASAGNALFVRELVLGARDRGDLVLRRGVWWLRGPLSSTPRLMDVVDDRVRTVSGEARVALELLAVWEQLGLADLESVAGAGPVEELDRAGLLEVSLDRRRQQVRLVHPLYGEVIRGGLAALTTRRLLLEGADRIEAHGARRRSDRLQIAVARVDAAGAADPELLLAAARVARQAYDHRLVEKLTRIADRAVVSTEQVILRAEALHELGEFDEVERLLAETVPGDEPRSAVQLVALRVRNLMWGLQRPADALAVNREVRDRVMDEADRDELVTDEALTLVHSNRPDEALLALSQMSQEPTARAAVLRSIAEIPALIATAAASGRSALVDDAYVAHSSLGDPAVMAHPGIHIVYKVQALLEAGRIDEAQELAALGSERTRRSGPPLGRTWFLLGLGRAALLAGRPRTAEKWLAEGVLMSMGTAFYGPHRVQLSLLAVAQSWLGDLDGATATIAELDSTPRSAFSEAEDDVGRAWTAVAAGNPLEAKEVLAKAATRAEAAGQRVVEARLLHDLLRIGDVARAAPRLAALASVCEGPLIAAFAQHAQAVSDGDGAALDAVSGRFETLGLMLVAAEASNAAGDAHRRAQDQRAANSSLAASKSLAMRCEGASTPGLMSTASLVPLTAREREIGTLAAAGVASREIAARLFLSKRTVDNHLQNIYSKLGIRSRSELAAGLHGTTVSPPPPSSPPP